MTMLQPGSRPIEGYPAYQLVRQCGAGAFGEVWHASGPGGIDVALKFIRLDGTAQHLELRSLDAVKSIRHPNLVSLFATWQQSSWLILAMELCDRALDDRLKEVLAQGLPGIPISELLIYMSDAANGLDELNAKHVQHRDVKPGNLLLVGMRVKVADFGLAKVLEKTVASNSGAGTIAYTAPECFRGTIAQQSDEYSLAITYYHLRTGGLPYTGDQAQIMYGHLELKADLSHLPPAERAVLERALSKEPYKRWPNCKAFVNELIEAQGKTAGASRAQGWVPGPQVTDHKGGRLLGEADFFAPPPAEIGEVLTACTTLKKSNKPLAPEARCWRVVIPSVIAAMIGLAFVHFTEERSVGRRVFWIGAIPAIAAAIAWSFTTFTHLVTYVGSKGLAQIRCRGNRDRIASEHQFLFAGASELRTAQTRHYRIFYHDYEGTSYQFRWSNDKGQKVFSLSGGYHNENGDPEKADDPYGFAHSAETIWSCHLLSQAQTELDSKKYLRFRLSGMDYVDLGYGIMHLHLGGEDATITSKEIGGIWLKSGQFTVRHKEARPGFLGFGSSGVFTFQYASMANGRLFFIALDKLMGYKFASE